MHDMRLRIALGLVAICGSAAFPRPALRTDLQKAIDAASKADNTTYSFAVAYGDLGSAAEVIEVFAGPNNREVPGSDINATTIFPAGSVAKPWLTLSALRLADPDLPVMTGGFRLDLDAPAVPIADKWLSAQGLQTVTDIFKTASDSDPTSVEALGTITTRMFLSMQSGFADYDDKHMQEWTKEHPDDDILPITWVANMTTHKLLFPPGQGVAYSGCGYVVAGMVVAAASGAKRWQDVSQLRLVGDLVGASPPAFNNTVFMREGPCSQYPGMVHQYGLVPIDSDEKNLALAAEMSTGQCGWDPDKPGVRVQGQVAASRAETDPTACCSLAQAVAKDLSSPIRWTFDASNGTCTVFDKFWGEEPSDKATSGDAGPKPQPEQCDGKKTVPGAKLVGMSIGAFPVQSQDQCCSFAKSIAVQARFPLGWTFESNSTNTTCTIFYNVIQDTPSEDSLSGFVDPPPLKPTDFYDLFGESCLNGWVQGNIATTPSDIARFYHMLAGGKLVNADTLATMQQWKNFTTGWDPGYFEYGMGLCRIASPTKLKNGSLTTAATFWGHPGVDWGSGMSDLVGYFPQLGVSMVLATSSAAPMNFTTGYSKSALTCWLEDAVIKHLKPELGRLDCGAEPFD